MNNLKKVRKNVIPVSFKNVTVNASDMFWKQRIETNRNKTLPLEGKIMEETGRIDAYKWEFPKSSEKAQKQMSQLWMGDVGKWIEAVSYSLATYPDKKLEAFVQDAVKRVIDGQKEDGYLYCRPTEPSNRWTNLRSAHELYDVGHLIEAAVAYYIALGKKDFLEAVCKSADNIANIFGSGKNQRRGYPGHPELELALVKLYRVTGEKRYLDLAKFFIDERGVSPHYYDMEARASGEEPSKDRYIHNQAHMPLREQQDAEGHSVRALYLFSGMADVASETGDESLVKACLRLWRSVTRKRMYITGGVGSSHVGEKFTYDYDLPNETAYAESCANIALVFFAHRMLQMELSSEYADVMERALYNGVLSGIGLDGEKFFYANHLTVYPDASKNVRDHIAPTRQKWFGCACCPPNIARIIASIGQYIYSQRMKEIYIHLYLANTVDISVNGHKVALIQKTGYPWKDKVLISVNPEKEIEFTLCLRIPGWCREAELKVNGEKIKISLVTEKGYAKITRRWKKCDKLEMIFSMPVEHIEANPNVRMDCGKVALQRGPLVYCLEEIDNGKNLADIVLPSRSKLKARFDKKLFGGAVVISGKAVRREIKGWDDILYRPVESKYKTVNIKAIPYCLWNNRKDGEMLVWIRGECGRNIES